MDQSITDAEALLRWQDAVKHQIRPARTPDQALMAEEAADIYALREGMEPPDPVELGWTPWGQAEHTDHLGNGILYLQTPGHGGLFVPDEVWNQDLPEAVRRSTHMARNTPHAANWAEEDLDLPLILPFIHRRLNGARLQAVFGEEAGPPDFWLREAARVVREYPEEYGPAAEAVAAIEKRR